MDDSFDRACRELVVALEKRDCFVEVVHERHRLPDDDEFRMLVVNPQKQDVRITVFETPTGVFLYSDTTHVKLTWRPRDTTSSLEENVHFMARLAEIYVPEKEKVLGSQAVHQPMTIPTAEQIKGKDGGV